MNMRSITLATRPNTLSVREDGVIHDVFVAPLARIKVRNEICPSIDTARWPILPLRNRRSPASVWPVPGAVPPDSLSVYRLGQDGERQALKRGIDYDLDAHFAGITLRDGWEIGRDTFSLDYDLLLQRVDVLAEKAGEWRLFHGAESLVSPRWPRLPAGWMGVARIHLRFCDMLGASALFPISHPEHARLINYPVLSDQAGRLPGGQTPEASAAETGDNPLWTDVIDYGAYVKGSPEAFDRLRRKCARAEPLRLVYFGDSITQGGDVDPDWRWTARFERCLRTAYPEKRIDVVNAAIGGTSSTFGRERFERDVIAHRPDVATILFALNDKKLDDGTFEANHRYFIDALRRSGCEPVLFTSNMNTAIWMPGLDHAEQRIVDFCRKHDLVCLDAYGIWKALPALGIPYESLLSNGINHPDNVAAGVFYELLMRAFGTCHSPPPIMA